MISAKKKNYYNIIMYFDWVVRGINVEPAVYFVETVLVEWLVWERICELKIKYKVRKWRQYAQMTFGECYHKEQETQLRWRGTKAKGRLLNMFVCRKKWRMRNGCCKVGGIFLWEQNSWIDEAWILVLVKGLPLTGAEACLLVTGGKVRM